MVYKNDNAVNAIFPIVPHTLELSSSELDACCACASALSDADCSDAPLL